MGNVSASDQARSVATGPHIDTVSLRAGDRQARSVRITWTETHFGGRRAYFACPECSARANILYAASYLACRKCHELAYRSENLTKLWRKNERLRKLQKTAGADPSRFPCPIPPKPKWQRWHTYLNLRRKIEKADHEFARAYVASRYGSGLFR
jgi:hypothetical protein